MSITILTGLPGSGKSAALIAAVNAARREGRPVRTFLCGESPTLLDQGRGGYGIVASRDPGETCPLHHFVGNRECAAILASLPPGTLVAFDEAYHFGPGLARAWIDASQRGLDVLLATPSHHHLRALDGHGYTEKALVMACERCAAHDAVTCIVSVGDQTTLSVCAPCEAELARAARAEIVDRLRRQAPYPGRPAVYQPVELDECADWRVLRPESVSRVELMTGVLRDAGLLDPGERVPTYLDVGCNTGFFCHRMRRLGFSAEGVDVVQGDIEVARLLDTFVRRDRTAYVVADADDYLHATRDRMVDVTSAFALSRWLMIQTTVDRAVDRLELLFRKTRQVCFLEMGYASEAQDAGRLPAQIDRSWVFNVMQRLGGFAEIRMYDAAQHGLILGSRDLFVGIKHPGVEDRPQQASPAVVASEPGLVQGLAHVDGR
jgi:hypothetical protein